MPTRVKSYEKYERGVLFDLHPSGKLRIHLSGDNIVRVTYSPTFRLPEKESLAVTNVDVEESFEWKLEKLDSKLVLTTRKIKVELDTETGLICFYNASGSPILKEEERRIFPVEVGGERVYSVEQVFSVSEDECFYGLGQHPGILNLKNRTVTLIQRNWDVAIPFLVSSRSYGILWDNYSMTRVSSISEKGISKLIWWSEVADSIEYYFIYGPRIDEIIKSYRRLTGGTPLLPRWAYGFWQSKERYASQRELVETAREFRRRGIPIDVIVQDWKYWGKYGWNAFKFDEESYPNPEEMVRDIHSLNMRLMISIWPTFDVETEVFKDMSSRGYICPGTKCYDPFNEKARQLYWHYIKKAFFDIGVDGWWLDATEPETGFGWSSFYTPFHETRTAMGSGARYLNAYSLMTTKAVYEGQRSISDKRVAILTRSSFLGQQRYSAITWSGDIFHDWGTLREQIPAGLGFCLSGIPYWTTDIGGFFSGNPETEAYQEIFIRWFQWGAFCPIFRVHGTTYPKEPWRFGSEAEKIIVDYIRLRYRLLPYIYSLAWKVTSEGYTIMRALVFDFKEDPNVLDIEDQYMFGPAIMVSPITLPGVDTRKVYLPEAEGGWYDFWTGRRWDGGRTIEVEAPLDKIPLHVKAGSIIPLIPPLQYTDEKPWTPIELRVYRGVDGSFKLYWDDGETYRYERGEYAIIPVEWIDSERRLRIGGKTGGYQGVPEELEFRIVLVYEGHGVGIEEAKPDRTIRYYGEPLEIKL